MASEGAEHGSTRSDGNTAEGTDPVRESAPAPEPAAAAPGPGAAPDPGTAAAVAAAEAAGPQSGEKVRTDSWIWSVRLLKTRSLAASACRGGHVRVNGERVKPAHSLRVGDEVRLRHEGRERVVVVKRLIRKRVGAPVAVQCYVDNSPPPPPRDAVAPAGIRDRGAGRPTKRDRRELERLRALGGPRGASGPGLPGVPEGPDAPAEPGGRGRRPSPKNTRKRQRP
ncbi:RNA-binding S4 domain-containing protein [Streptomyces prasinopilosus]|uniref:Ribosome-associated heat shock protein Hsp15 n=1 Tax=Streptomyces prasinopilosus TaxID=67344 RepID=A0A1G6K6L0_9ACTN|nr:RNA-binding S4 domain-containing protein [Streptomyces prasinopilosus]SDC26481.1 ribosome-associated heat shock protein Hsp15 [Streptomyces prasinopilosus]